MIGFGRDCAHFDDLSLTRQVRFHSMYLFKSPRPRTLAGQRYVDDVPSLRSPRIVACSGRRSHPERSWRKWWGRHDLLIDGPAGAPMNGPADDGNTIANVAWPERLPSWRRARFHHQPGRGRPQRGGRNAMLIEMAIKGLMIDQVTSTPIIVLRQGRDPSSIWVGVFEANHCRADREHGLAPADDARPAAQRHRGSPGPRRAGGDLRRQGRHLLRHHPPEVRGDTLAIDARPSDAIALALRAKAPIFAEEHVIEQAKQAEPATSEGETERLQKWLESLDPDDMGKYKM
jgi:bifunctional DNase/RNase